MGIEGTFRPMTIVRYTQAEKLEIIRAVEESDLPAKRTLAQLQVNRWTETGALDHYRFAHAFDHLYGAFHRRMGVVTFI